MKLLYLTGIVKAPNDSGEEKLSKAKSKRKDGIDGMPRSWYIENSLKPPPEADDEVEFDEDGNVILEENDLDDVGVDVNIPVKVYGGVEDDLDFGSTVYTTYGVAFRVLETATEIESYIEYSNYSWLRKKYLKIKYYFAHKQNKN